MRLEKKILVHKKRKHKTKFRRKEHEIKSQDKEHIKIMTKKFI